MLTRRSASSSTTAADRPAAAPRPSKRQRGASAEADEGTNGADGARTAAEAQRGAPADDDDDDVEEEEEEEGGDDDDDELMNEQENGGDEEEDDDDDEEDEDEEAERDFRDVTQAIRRRSATALPPLARLAAVPSASEASRYSITSLKAELNLRKISAAVPRGINGDAAKAALAARLVALWALTREGADVSATAMPELPAREVCRRCPHRLLLGLSRN
jgi:hypothetical protein